MRMCPKVESYLLTDRSLTLFMSFRMSSMFGNSAGLVSKTVWQSVLFPRLSFIKSMAENDRCIFGGGGGGGGGGGSMLPLG